MQWFQDYFVAALFGLVVACVIAKFVSVAFYGGDDNDSKVKVDANKVVKVVEQVNLGNAFKVKESRSKKRVKFVDDVVVRHADDQLGFIEQSHEIGEEIKRVVFSGEEGVIVEGKNEKDGIYMCSDEQKVNEDGNILIYSDELNKGMIDESSEREIIDKTNDIANFDHHLRLEEENVISRGDTEKVEILNCADEQGMNEDGKMFYALEEASELGFICHGDSSINLDEPFCVKGKLQTEAGLDDLTIEEKVIKEETSTSGSVLEALMVDDKMNNEGFSSQSYVDFESEHAKLRSNENNLVERLGENMEAGLSDRDEKEDRMQAQGENMEGGLNIKDEERAIKNENVVIDEEDDDWEGIERTELEKVFAEAVNYVEFGLKAKDDELAKLGSDVQMQLYGLHKIAVEGSCHQAQPMALNFSARAKWIK
ncbi:hypothetical protein Leryth_017156 [Lithospermum erythrorhizon]|nr:hypothetical protein Leryth_017156 [Lithospermum erythrorhizon]